MTFYIDAGGFLRCGSPPECTDFVTVVPSWFRVQYFVAYTRDNSWISIRYFDSMALAYRSAAQFRRNGVQAIAGCTEKREDA